MSSIWTIRRSATDVKLTGLCGGVAQHWGIDPVLVRVGWALLALSGGIGLVLYLAGWLLIPVEGSDKALVDDLFGESVRRWPRELWITLVVVASLRDVHHLRVAQPVHHCARNRHRSHLVFRLLQGPAKQGRQSADPDS